MKILLNITFTVLLGIFVSPNFAQIGGSQFYPILNYGMGERTAAVGGRNIAQNQLTPASSWHNPAMADSSLHLVAETSYTNYFAGLQRLSAHFTYHTTHLGTFSLHAMRFGYGEFQAADASGNLTGTFTASDNFVGIAWSYPLIDSVLRVGVGAKAIFSAYEQYHATALLADWGLLYRAPDGLLAAGLVARNLGGFLVPFVDGQTGQMPWGIDVAVSKKLEHAPFRFNLTISDLQYWQLARDRSQDATEWQFATAAKPTQWYHEMLLHTAFGVEFIPAKQFSLMASYNARIRSELLEENLGGISGFALGIAIGGRRMRLTFNNLFYHKVASVQQFTFVYSFKK